MIQNSIPFMIQNFFKLAVRNLARHKGFSFINIAGLTLGLTACLLIGLFVWDERQFDRFVPEADQVYRIYYKSTGAEGTSIIASTPSPFATTLRQEFPEVEVTARFKSINAKDLVEANGKKLYEVNGAYADPAFLEIFPLTFQFGSASRALNDPASIILSQEMAERFFGKNDPVGKQVLIENSPLQVKGVFRSNPKFHLPINYILPLSAAGISETDLQNWHWYAFYNYVKLKKGADVASLEPKFQSQVHTKINELKAQGFPVLTPYFQSLNKVHLHSASFKHDIAVRGNITYVNALTAIAVFILIIACFNFVNLATAKSVQRAKEVGVRKTIGASRKGLMIQFIAETVLFAFISIIFSIALTYVFLPWMNQFTEKQIPFEVFANPLLWLLLLGLILAVGILAGLYPALVLSGFKPVRVLKGAVVSDARPGLLRHGLVVVQFSLSIILIICAIVVIRQVNYLHSKDLGFSKEQIMFFPMRGDKMFGNYETFKDELQRAPGVSSVSIGYGFPGDMFGDGPMTIPGGARLKCTQMMVDHDYIPTLGLKLVAGRNFDKNIQADKDEAFILNETAVRELGLGTPQKAVGQDIHWNTWANFDSLKKGKVIGVVKDFHYKSLYDKLEPAVLQIYPNAYWKVAVKIRTAEVEPALAHVKKVWATFSPDDPIEYNFLDESFTTMYKSEDKLKSLLWIFTIITIFVACLGLFGLAAYAAERRKKEIGVRKVLGASSQGLVLLLSRDFLKLVVISVVIASPVAWYAMNSWLQAFAYRIQVQWWMFTVAGIMAIFIALLTVSFQAIKAALSNPVMNLRTE
jgi:putative ABC transport system permease protein